MVFFLFSHRETQPIRNREPRDDVRIVGLEPNRDHGFDVSDWLAEGGTIEQLKALVE
jgi:hypothetical protein